MPELNDLENTIIDLLLAGDHPTLALLRKQLQAATIISSRTFTGTGFYSKFSVPDHIDRVPRKNFEIGDIGADISGLSHGAGFILFIRGGLLSWLEGFTYDELWPAEPAVIAAYYVHHEPAGSPMLRRCAVRDLSQLREDIEVPRSE